MVNYIGFGIVSIVFASLVACGGAEGSEGTDSAPAVEQGQIQELGGKPTGGTVTCPANLCPSRHNTACAPPVAGVCA
jgi:hypothetical protein